MSTSQTKLDAGKAVTHFRKPQRSFWQIWNMSFGFLGIQFGWGLQMANMSAIYEYLGARADQIPILWLAAPLTGLIVQPIIGHASDHTWDRLGRRRPYFLTGAILSSLALILMPRLSALWMAAGLLWILDASINISMEPFRAFVADLLPEEQRTRGFAMQSLFIGLGAVVASALPWLLTNCLAICSTGRVGARDPADRAAVVLYRRGGILRRGAVDDRAPRRNIRRRIWKHFGEESQSIGASAANARGDFRRPSAKCRDTMRQLAPVQLLHLAGAVLHVAVLPGGGGAQRVRRDRPELAGLYTAAWNGAASASACTPRCALASSFFLPRLAKARWTQGTHTVCACSAAPLGLLSVAVIHDKNLLLLSMVGRGHCLGEHALHAVLGAGGVAAGRAHRRLHGHLQLLHRAAGNRGFAGIRLGDEPRAQQQPAGRRDRRRRIHGSGGGADAARRRSAHVKRAGRVGSSTHFFDQRGPSPHT